MKRTPKHMSSCGTHKRDGFRKEAEPRVSESPSLGTSSLSRACLLCSTGSWFWPRGTEGSGEGWFLGRAGRHGKGRIPSLPLPQEGTCKRQISKGAGRTPTVWVTQELGAAVWMVRSHQELTARRSATARTGTAWYHRQGSFSKPGWAWHVAALHLRSANVGQGGSEWVESKPIA